MQQRPRPLSTMLNTLTLMSIIASAFAVFYGLSVDQLNGLSYDELRRMLSETMPPDSPAMEQMGSDAILGSIVSFARMSLWLALFNLMEFASLIVLRNRRWGAFHAYTASQIGQVGIYCLAFGVAGSTLPIIWAVIWVLVYRHLIAEERKLDEQEG